MFSLFIITIVIPAYNEESVIGDCIKNLVQDTQKKMEIIVSNDGFTDKTEKVAMILTFEKLNIWKSYHKVTKKRECCDQPGNEINLEPDHCDCRCRWFI